MLTPILSPPNLPSRGNFGSITARKPNARTNRKNRNASDTNN
nr:MAG TPA: hypothetical protein [Bacteriophage sp.]